MMQSESESDQQSEEGLLSELNEEYASYLQRCRQVEREKQRMVDSTRAIMAKYRFGYLFYLLQLAMRWTGYQLQIENLICNLIYVIIP